MAKPKIDTASGEDILILRAQGKTWPDIAEFLNQKYDIEITQQGVSAWFKKNEKETKKVSIRDEYESSKGEKEVKEELLALVDVMGRVMNVGLDMLKTIEETPQDKKIMWHNAYKNISAGIISAAKTKLDMLSKDDEKRKETEDTLNLF